MINQSKSFIDLFAGCGGLSLGLMQAGWQGLFAIEKNPDAFLTLSRNLCQENVQHNFDWPSWLPTKSISTNTFLKKFPNEISQLEGTVDLIAGGPPCQGFSFAGRRDPADPRNTLTNEYIRIVRLVKPKILLIENVRGFDSPFPEKKKSYAKLVAERLSKLKDCNYTVYTKLLKASEFGVPQPRPRFIMIALRNDINLPENNPFKLIAEFTLRMRSEYGLGTKVTTVKQAIGDLVTIGRTLIECDDSRGFKQLKYGRQKGRTAFQKLMRTDVKPDYAPNSLRIPNHREATLERFQTILSSCPKGKSLSEQMREKLGMKKQCFTPLDPDRPATTITTLPDDVLHYCEPRILTVRENARLQSFPDWFEFHGKYTTGGTRRKKECPRYSQVGNAVPPLMAEAIGRALLSLLEQNG